MQYVGHRYTWGVKLTYELERPIVPIEPAWIGRSFRVTRRILRERRENSRVNKTNVVLCCTWGLGLCRAMLHVCRADVVLCCTSGDVVLCCTNGKVPSASPSTRLAQGPVGVNPVRTKSEQREVVLCKSDLTPVEEMEDGEEDEMIRRRRREQRAAPRSPRCRGC